MSGDRENCGVGNQNIGRPRHWTEVSGRRFDAVKHQVLRANERDEAEPAVRGKWPAARAKKFHDENRNGRRGQDNSKFHHASRLLRYNFASFWRSCSKKAFQIDLPLLRHRSMMARTGGY